MRCLTPASALAGDCGFLSANLYAKSVFGNKISKKKRTQLFFLKKAKMLLPISALRMEQKERSQGSFGYGARHKE